MSPDVSQQQEALFNEWRNHLRQGFIYEPGIIIACGVGDIAKQTSNGLEWLRPPAHPQARLSHKELYEYVIKGLAEINALPPTRGAT